MSCSTTSRRKISRVKEKQVTPNENTHPVTQLIAETVIDSTSVQTPITRVQNDINSKLVTIPSLTARVLNKSKADISPKQLNIRNSFEKLPERDYHIATTCNSINKNNVNKSKWSKTTRQENT
jgi:hypothetical protein